MLITLQHQWVIRHHPLRVIQRVITKFHSCLLHVQQFLLGTVLIFVYVKSKS